ncbi:hypothetical protein JCM8097_004131 [Rhodosporidiobolus ruineniae]
MPPLSTPLASYLDEPQPAPSSPSPYPSRPSTPPTESDSFDLRCWVCRDKTKNCCAPCEQAGLRLFLCSKECQRLVWPIHRFFCGPGKANPFNLPPLTPEEAVEAKQHAGDEYADDQWRVKRTTLLRELEKRELLNEEPLSTLLESLSSATRSRADEPARAHQLALAAIRTSESYRVLCIPSAPIPPPADVTVIFGQLSRFFVGSLKELCDRPSEDVRTETPWLAPLLHRMSISFYLILANPKWSVDNVGRSTVQVQFMILLKAGRHFSDEANPEVPFEAATKCQAIDDEVREVVKQAAVWQKRLFARE